MIVLLRPNADVDAALKRGAERQGAKADLAFRQAVRGYAAKLTPSQVLAITLDSAVAAVVPDAEVELTAQAVPTGISRVGAIGSPIAAIDGTDDRVDVDVAIIDTGIQPDHPDLNVAGGYNCTTSDPTDWADGAGHGTHVAGIVGALDNDVGVVGVAPGARMWSVRVFDSASRSKISWIVCGIDWITAQRDPDDITKPLIEVANMSLRDAGTDDGNCGYANNDIEHQAICRSVIGGTTYLVAAGNDGTSTTKWRPSSYDEVITVSALADYDGLAGGLASASCRSFGVFDVDDTIARFSNYGVDVDLIAPGACIRSTWTGSLYATISGTSMATPTAAGAAALCLAAHPGTSPADVRLALRAAGSLDWRTWSDRDTTNEPLVDVSSFGAGPGLGVSAPSEPIRVWAGMPSTGVPVKIVRLDGFTDAVTLALEGVPAGVQASLSQTSFTGWNTGPARLTVTAGSQAEAGTWPLTLVATSGSLAARRMIELIIHSNAVAPIVDPPTESILVDRKVTKRGVYLRTTWAGTDDGSGIVAWKVRERRGTAKWRTIVSAGAVTSRSARLPIGVRLRHKARATDLAGDRSAYAAGPEFALHTISEASSALTYTKNWRTRSSSSARGGRISYSGRVNATATLRVTARSVAWISSVGPNRGRANVFLDGVFLTTGDCYSASAKTKRIVFATDLEPGSHELTIVVEGTAGRPRVDVDGFVLLR